MGKLQILQSLLGQNRLGQEAHHAVFLLLLGQPQLNGEIPCIEVQRAKHPEGRSQNRLAQTIDISRQHSGIEIEDALHLVPVCTGNGIAGDG